MERLLLDTNILCASILRPGGLCFKLLTLGLYKVYEPIISEVVVAEFINKCRVGMTRKNITFTDEQIDMFLEAISPMLSSENIKKVGIGRGFMLNPQSYQEPLNHLLYNLTNRTREELIDTVYEKTSKRIMPSQVDLDDLHVMVAAIENKCDYIVTMNVKDFPNEIGSIKVVRPEMIYANFLE